MVRFLKKSRMSNTNSHLKQCISKVLGDWQPHPIYCMIIPLADIRTCRIYKYSLFVFLALQPTVVVFFTARWQAFASSCSRFLDHTQRRTTVGRNSLDEWSARRTDIYLTTHNTHNRQTSMPPVGFKPKIAAGERLYTYALDRTATGTGTSDIYVNNLIWLSIREEFI